MPVPQNPRLLSAATLRCAGLGGHAAGQRWGRKGPAAGAREGGPHAPAGGPRLQRGLQARCARAAKRCACFYSFVAPSAHYSIGGAPDKECSGDAPVLFHRLPPPALARARRHTRTRAVSPLRVRPGMHAPPPRPVDTSRAIAQNGRPRRRRGGPSGAHGAGRPAGRVPGPGVPLHPDRSVPALLPGAVRVYPLYPSSNFPPSRSKLVARRRRRPPFLFPSHST